ncbi:MAG: tRNA lysidine(34) synthetase TilS [Alphaproteobacteria bacterium]|nr:tRNA lysidine(34) synthetase TilS [Alphaproteobacteria bacterium]
MYLSFSNINQTIDLFSYELGSLFFFSSDGRFLNKSICVAVSGGSDSVSLLLLAYFWAQQNGAKIVCVTVDHKLRSESLDEALYVKNICSKLKVPHTILSWNHEKHLNEGKVENLARQARYDLLKKYCSLNDINFVATGHTWNDQLETYELRKNAGSGPVGLACMSQIRSLSDNVKILRPLLRFSKIHLEGFLRNVGIEWKIDPMNFDENFRRVAVRNRISEYNNESLKNISNKILTFGIQRHKTEKDAVSFIKNYVKISNYGYCVTNLSDFSGVSEQVQAEIFRRVIWLIGGKKYPVFIQKNTLKNILNFKINTIGRCLIKITKYTISIFRENRNIPAISAQEAEVLWDNRFLVNLKKTQLGDNFMIRGCFSTDREKFFTEIPKSALAGFPCLYLNHQVKCNFDEWGEAVRFRLKPELFDVYYGVGCAQKL